MKILVASDIHGNLFALAQLKTEAQNVDLVLFCGDITSKYNDSEIQQKCAHELYEIFDEIRVPCRFIQGNCDNFELNYKYYLSKEESINGIRIIPFEYVLPTPGGVTFRETSEEFIAQELEKIDGHNSIMLAHQPPFGAGDAVNETLHVGSHAIKAWIEKNQPLYWLCGHIHEANGEYKIGSTIVINAATDDENNQLNTHIIEI